MEEYLAAIQEAVDDYELTVRLISSLEEAETGPVLVIQDAVKEDYGAALATSHTDPYLATYGEAVRLKIALQFFNINELSDLRLAKSNTLRKKWREMDAQAFLSYEMPDLSGEAYEE